MSKYQAYPEYKDSGVEWLEKLPKHWEKSQLRYMFLLGKGLTITKANLEDEGVPCVNYGEVHSKYGFEVDPKVHPLKYVSEDYLQSSPNALLKKGDFVFADTSEDIVGSGNFTQLISDEKVFAGYHTIIARPNERERSRYYAYLLDSLEVRTQVRHAVKGVKVFSITQEILRGINIWFPPQGECEKIANFLDHETAKIDTLIDKQQQLIQLLKEKRQAVISHAVTKGLNPNAPMRDSGVAWLGEVPEHWVLARLKNVLRIRNGRDYKDVEVEEGGYPVYGSGGIFKRSSDYLHNGKSVLFGRKGTIDKPLVVSGKFWTVDTMFYSEVFDNASPEYIFYQAIFFPFNLLSTNTALPSMTQEDLLMLPFVVPPRIEQEGIIKYVQDKSARFDNLIGKAQSAIELMQERRTALISAAVTGKIDVRHPASHPTGDLQSPKSTVHGDL